MKEIYLLLTRSETLVSRLIHRCTGDEYTHVSVAFDPNLTALCSFARRNAALPLPAGLVVERLNAGYYADHRHMPCMLLAFPAREAGFEAARDHVEWMLCAREAYRYNLRGLALCALGVPRARVRRYFCSQFAAEVLKRCGLPLPRPAELTRPQDFAAMPGARTLYKGRISGLARERMGANVDFR